jgi:FixJ family two-component response regulator
MKRKGFLSKRRFDIIELACRGLPPREIARLLGTTNNCVKATMSQLRRSGYAIPKFTSPGRQNRRHNVNTWMQAQRALTDQTAKV